MKPEISTSPRIAELRKYYLENARMACDRSLGPGKCHRLLSLYTEGWIKSGGATTVRFRRSMAEAYMLKNMRPVINDGELIVGQPDFEEFTAEEKQKYNYYAELCYRVMPVKRGRADHLAPDYETLLQKGVNGIINDAQAAVSLLKFNQRDDFEKYEFYMCLITELEGLLELAKKYMQYALSLSLTADDKRKAELIKIAETLGRVPAEPAHTFREALQSIHFFTFSLFGLYSAGRPDQYLYRYYRSDIDSGVITEAEAQELIDCYCLLYATTISPWAAAGFMLGGRDRAGNAVENELTWHFLASAAHTHIPDPNIAFCITDETSRDILAFASKIVSDGHGHPSFWNDSAITASMLVNGYEAETARLYTHSTCVEVTPIGYSGVSITSPYINLLKIFIEVFGKCGDGVSFDEIIGRFSEEFGLFLDREMLVENLWQMERGRNCTDPIRVSALIHDCMENGRCADDGGARYNYIEPNILGMTNVIESLNSIYNLVYVEKKLTITEFNKILADDYKDREDVLTYIRSSLPHFGSNDEFTNNLAKRVADTVLTAFAGRLTYRGASIIPGAFSYREHEIQGGNTPASPDGRKAGMPLADGSGPVQGYDVKGPLASLLSTVSWEPARFLGGTAVNVKLNRNLHGLSDIIVSLVLGYVKAGGSQLQFTVTDREELLDAQKNPDSHRNLLVRIGGYCDFFVGLPENLQNEVIRRTENVV